MQSADLANVKLSRGLEHTVQSVTTQQLFHEWAQEPPKELAVPASWIKNSAAPHGVICPKTTSSNGASSNEVTSRRPSNKTHETTSGTADSPEP